MTYKIAFFDIDGTLSDTRLYATEPDIFKRIPESAKKALLALKEVGIEPVIATGRNYGVAKNLLENLQIDSVIASNGQYVLHQRELLFEKNLEDDMVASIVKRLDFLQLDYAYETADSLFIHAGSQFQKDLSLKVQVIERGIIPDSIIQILVLDDRKESLNLDIEGVKAIKVAPFVYDVLDSKFSKAVGIKIMLDKMGVLPEEALAFGDEENDLEMFQIVGKSIAMGNGNDILKKEADFVTKAVHEDGIWHACKALYLF